MEYVASVDVDILRSVIDVSCDAFDQAVIVYDRNDALLFVSKQILKFFPLSSDDLMPGTAMRHLLGAIFDSTERYHGVDPRTKSRLSREDWIAHRLATQWNEKFDSISKYGADRWLHAKGGRSPSGIGITILQDISEIERRERRFKADQEHMNTTEAVLDEMPFPLYVKDSELSFVGVNKAFCAHYDVQPEEVLGRTVWDISNGTLAGRLDASNRVVLETGEPSRTFEEKQGSDGKLRKYVRHEFRVGKPGGYFLVTVLDELSTVDRSDLSSGQEAEARSAHADVSGDQPDPPEPEFASFEPERRPGVQGGNERILVVSADPVFSKQCVEVLTDHGFEAVAVVSAEEEEAFLAASKSMLLLPQMALIDERLIGTHADLAESFGVVAMPIDSGRPVHFIIADILANLPPLSRRGKPEMLPDEADGLFAPVGLPAFEGPDEQAIYRYSDVEVLVVEDNAVNQEVFSSILDSMGIAYQIASSGEEALVLFDELRPKLVFMDVTLPGIDACEAANRIALLDGDRPTRTPIVGVLPKEDAEAEAGCRRAGMASCIVKPISTEALELVYGRYVDNKHDSDAGRKKQT